MAGASGIRWGILLHALAGLALAAPAAAAAPPDDFGAWLARTTDLKSAQIALIGEDSVYSLEPQGAALPTGEVVALVRTEPLADDWAAAHGFASWDATLLVDCPNRRLRVIRSATYPRRNRVGTPSPEPQDYAAMTPLREHPAARLLAAACDADFAWPLRPPAFRLAQATLAAPMPSADPAAPPRGWVLQLARGPSEDGAKRAVGAARKALGSDARRLTGWTMPVTGEAAEHAALLGLFASYVEADAACRTLLRARQDCLIRRKPGDPEPLPAAAPVIEQAAAETPATGPTTYAVQVARGPSEDGARRALARARKALGPLVQPVRDALPESRVPGDHVRYDARLEGFPTAEAARQACRRLSSAGQDCFALEVSSAGPPAVPGPG